MFNCFLLLIQYTTSDTKSEVVDGSQKHKDSLKNDNLKKMYMKASVCIYYLNFKLMLYGIIVVEWDLLS